MKKASSVNTTPRWRRSEQAGTLVGVRLQPDELAAVDKWIAKAADQPTRPEGVRRLMKIGLSGDKPAGRTSTKTAARAAELAGEAIDRQSDPTVPAEERATRKRRVLSGPSPFRDTRIDLKPKKNGT